MLATVSSRTILAALAIARMNGLDDHGLAARAGIEGALEQGDARLPHRVWVELWQAIVDGTGDDAVGLRAAETLPWGHFDVIDYLVGTSADLGDALARFCRHFALVSTGVDHRLETRGSESALVRRYAPDCETRLLAPAEFGFASVVLRTRIASGVAWRPAHVRFAAPEPRSPEVHRRFFDCPVTYDADLSEIVVDRVTLALPMRAPDAALLGLLERHATMLAAGLRSADAPVDDAIVARTRRAIVAGLREAEVSLDAIARRLGTSGRTLQRRLRDEGSSFDAVLDDARSELARRYLEDRSLSIQETSHLLGFGHARGFHRAFRRWEGCTPNEFRERTGRMAPAGPPSAS